MRREFLRKTFNSTLGDGFDATKKISDYVGMLTRLVFLSVISAFIADTIDFSTVSIYSITDILRIAFLFLILLLNVFFGLAFVQLSRSIMWATFWIDRPTRPGRCRRIAFEIFQPALIVFVLISMVAIVVSTPLVVRELANKQMHREVKPQANIAPAQ